MTKNKSNLSRRDLLKAATIAGVGLTTESLAAANLLNDLTAEPQRPPRHQTMMGVKFEPRDTVRLGIIGVGLRGTDVLGEFLAIERVQVNAVCDLSLIH